VKPTIPEPNSNCSLVLMAGGLRLDREFSSDVPVYTPRVSIMAARGGCGSHMSRASPEFVACSTLDSIKGPIKAGQ
jgi:hypothetical protein